MPVPTDPIVLVLTAIVLWSFWIACVLRDRQAAADAGPRRDTMPSVVGGVGVQAAHPPRSLDPKRPSSSKQGA